MSVEFAARRRNGSTGRLPSLPRALAMPAKHVMSVGLQQLVPPGLNAAGHDAGGENAVLWNCAADTVTPRLVSHELYSSLIGPPFVMSASRPCPFGENARLLRSVPTDVTVVPSSPSMSTSVPLLNDVLL